MCRPMKLVDGHSSSFVEGFGYCQWLERKLSFCGGMSLNHKVFFKSMILTLLNV